MLGPASAHPGPETLRRIEPRVLIASRAGRCVYSSAARALTLQRSSGAGPPRSGWRPSPPALPRTDRDTAVSPDCSGSRDRAQTCASASADSQRHQALGHLVDPSRDQIWLTGFGIALRVPRARQPPTPPEFIAGTLLYIAPEQTGRMNRSIDSRSDLYSVRDADGDSPVRGVRSNGPRTRPYCATASPAPPTVEGHSGPVSGIVMKLLATTAEERYQTAASAERDLRRCLDEWATRGWIDEFPPGRTCRTGC
jgi:hypothetical protein